MSILFSFYLVLTSFFKATNQVTYQYLDVHLNFKISTLLEHKYTSYSSDVKVSNTSGEQT